jgi:hypothetical protein
LKTPLAYFRGFQLASGVEPGGRALSAVLREAALLDYFRRQRLAQVYQTRVMVAAIRNNDNLMREAFQSYSEALFPEIGDQRDAFRDRASREMKQWRNKVIVLQGGSAKIRNVDEVAGELAELTKRSWELRAKRKKAGK